MACINICVNASQELTVKSNPRKVTPSTLGIVGGGAVKCILLPTLTRLKTPSRWERSQKWLCH